jgi:hypothetical protein
VPDIPTAVSLAVVLSVLAITTFTSLRSTRGRVAGTEAAALDERPAGSADHG